MQIPRPQLRSLIQALSNFKKPCSKAAIPNFYGTRDQFHGRHFFHIGWVGWFGCDSSACITFIVHSISIITICAPPQIIRHWIPEVGHTCSKAPSTCLPIFLAHYPSLAPLYNYISPPNTNLTLNCTMTPISNATKHSILLW